MNKNGMQTYKGVKPLKKKGKVDRYQGRIMDKRKKIMLHMGTFDTSEEAAAIYAKAVFYFKQQSVVDIVRHNSDNQEGVEESVINRNPKVQGQFDTAEE
jgi:transposase